jgi:hypothetical protein
LFDPYASEPQVKSSSRVSAELQRLAPLYGFSVADNVLFTRGLISATVDHVVIDRWGVLIVDAESHEGASVHGTDTDTKWTATFPNGQVAEFRNPLYLNTGNENLVKQTLADVGISLEPAEIRSAVVFVGADISRLSLVEVSAAKIKTADTLSELFDSRRSFPPSSGRLTGADIDRIVNVIAQRAQALPIEEEIPAGPWQSDPAAVASTQAALLVPPPPSRTDGGPYRAPVELAGHHTGPAEGPSMRSALLTLGTITVIVLTVVAGIVFFPQLQAGSTVAWTVTLVLFVALAELVAANIATARRTAGHPREGGVAGGVLRFAARLFLVFLLVAGMWVFVAGGVAGRLGESLEATFSGNDPSVADSSIEPPSPGLIAAKRRLREKAPQVYKRVINLDEPNVHEGDAGKTSYTWTYTPKGASQPASFTLTIDPQGQLVSP